MNDVARRTLDCGVSQVRILHAVPRHLIALVPRPPRFNETLREASVAEDAEEPCTKAAARRECGEKTGEKERRKRALVTA